MGSEDARSVEGDQSQSGPAERLESGEQGQTSTSSSKRPSENDLPDRRTNKKSKGNKTRAVLQSELDDAKASINSLSSNCSRLKREKNILKDQIKELQKSMMDLREEHNLPKMDDGDVRNRLQNLMNRYRDWAREYSTEEPVDFDALRSSDVQRSLDETPFMQTASSGDLDPLGNFIYGKYILLNSLLVHFVCWFIVDNPLFFLNREFLELEICPSREFLSELMECVPRHKKDAWIGWTLRTLEPKLQGHGGDSPIIEYNGILSRTTTFYEKSTQSFIDMVAPLLKPLSEGAVAKRLRSLVHIMATTGTLVLRLRQQNYDVKSLSYDSGLLQGETFSRESNTMEPHPALRLKQDDKSLDGADIDFTIQPAIIASWFDGPEEEERVKVWTKAVVWAGGCKQIGTKQRGGTNCVSGSDIKGEPAPTPQTVNKRIDELLAPMQHSNKENRAESSQPEFSIPSPSETSSLEQLSAVEIPAVSTSHKPQAKDSPMDPSEISNKPMDHLASEAKDTRPIVNTALNPAPTDADRDGPAFLSRTLNPTEDAERDDKPCEVFVTQDSQSEGNKGDIVL
ncbi:hypothetical protein EMPG_17131 [Blastomyces silverae]|uniref:Uncharacterized protein n=1 Tax=Blastomyces silverae TaxID=2060906 RepID=A0A0H1BDY1_9EURO|nr:hypothetical protein EMPG_17131 [Blastomyces silverae]